MTTTTTMMAAPRAPHRGSARHSQHKLQRLSCEAQNQTTVPSEFLLIIIVSSSALRRADRYALQNIPRDRPRKPNEQMAALFSSILSF
eukprot:COSAG06_NODE_12283_length_1399_cov_3.133846_3_plen_87_part_01